MTDDEKAANHLLDMLFGPPPADGVVYMPLSTRIWQKQQVIEQEAKVEHAAMLVQLGKKLNLKPEEIEFDSVSCVSRSSTVHIYKKSLAPHGVGHRVCLMCGIDDFDL